MAADYRPDIDPIHVRPSMGTYNTPKTFRFWCQKVLPLVYDDSLSYYELLCKVVDYLNKTMEDVNTAVEDVTNLNNAFGSLENHVNASETALLQAYTDLQNYVNGYFDSLDFQQAINDKLDEMAEDGTLDSLLLPHFNEYVESADAQIQESTQNMEEFVLNYVAEARGQIRDATTEMQNTLNSEIDSQNDRIDTVENQFNQLIALQTAGTMQGAKITTFRAVNPLEYTVTTSDVLKYQSFSFVDHAGNQNTNPSMSVLDGLVNPTLVSAGAYVLDNQTDPVTGKCIYINLSSTTRFYPTGGFLGNDPDKRAVRFSVNYDAVDIYPALTGKWLVFEFSVLSDVPTDLSEITDARVGADGVTYQTLGSAIRTQIGDLQNQISDYIDTIGENIFDSSNPNVIGRYINVAENKLGQDSKPCPLLVIEPNSLYIVECNISSHKRVATSTGYAVGDTLTNCVDGSTNNHPLYIVSGNADKFLIIQLYTDADSIKTGDPYYPSLSVRKIANVAEKTTNPPASMFSNGYIGYANGIYSTTSTAQSNITLSTKEYIQSQIRIIKCDSPYVIRYYQYDANNNYIGCSDKSALLVIPDNAYKYKLSITYAINTETTPMVASSVVEHVSMLCTNIFDTRYGKSAYFAPFNNILNYYPTYCEDFTDFTRETTTAELYAKLDTLINASNGYISKTQLGLCSDGVQQLIRLDCVESGVDAKRTARNPKPKIIIVAGQHGGEKCSCYSLYYLLYDLLYNWDKNGILEYIRYNAHLIIIPVANPYGFDHVQYTNYNDVNLNRNYVYNWNDSGSGSSPLSEPETQIIANLVKEERSAIYLADYHCQGDGTVLPATGRPNWHSQLQTYDYVHDSIGDCSKTHIDNISRHWWSEYTFLNPVTYVSCGQVDTGYWDTGLPTLQGYASRNGIVSNTFEGLNGFTGRTGFGAEGAKACTELIGNWIIAVLRHFAEYYDCSKYE